MTATRTRPSVSTANAHAIHVPAGHDIDGDQKLMIWGLIPLAIKVPTQSTGGSLFVFQHTDMGKGGPPRHVHHAQDEWFYAIRGQFRAEIGGKSFTLNPGDSLLAPRGIPHAWACVSDEPGTIITAVTPAGTFEEFIRDTARHPTLPPPDEIARAFEKHGMTVLGPPLEVW